MAQFVKQCGRLGHRGMSGFVDAKAVGRKHWPSTLEQRAPASCVWGSWTCRGRGRLPSSRGGSRRRCRRPPIPRRRWRSCPWTRPPPASAPPGNPSARASDPGVTYHSITSRSRVTSPVAKLTSTGALRWAPEEAGGRLYRICSLVLSRSLYPGPGLQQRVQLCALPTHL